VITVGRSSSVGASIADGDGLTERTRSARSSRIRPSSGPGIAAAVFGAVIAILLAEIYAYYVGTMIGDGRRPTREEFVAVVLATFVGAAAALPPIALLMLGVSGAISLASGFTAAKWAGSS
jgi:hypothetical protein